MEEGKIHFDSKLLAVHLMNAETKINDFGLMRIIKKGYTDKIDLADALINFCLLYTSKQLQNAHYVHKWQKHTYKWTKQLFEV